MIRKPIKDVKVSLTQNIQRAINKADHCEKIPLKLIHLLSWAAVDETDEDADKKYVLGDTLEELD